MIYFIFQAFRKKGCVLPYNTAPHDVLSISTFDESNKNEHSFAIYDASFKKIKLENVKKEKTSEDESENNDNIHNNEMNITDNIDKQNLRKRKIVPEKSSTADENAEIIKIKRKRKETMDHSVTDQQNEKEKASKDEIKDNDKTCDNETNVANNSNRQSVKKRKLSSEKLFVTDESNIKIDITENSNTEKNQETLNKNINRKVTEKKKKRLTIDDTNVMENVTGEMKKESHKSATKSNKNKGTKPLYLNTNDGKIISNEEDGELQTEEHSVTRDSGMTNSDIEETNVDEKKKKKNRKKRSKIQEDDICNTLGLHVMAKPDWKRLRNKYLELQRTKMQLLKGHLRKSENMTGKKWYYDTGLNYKLKNEKDNRKINETEKSFYGRISYTPGIIVKVEMDEPCTDPQSFKVYQNYYRL